MILPVPGPSSRTWAPLGMTLVMRSAKKGELGAIEPISRGFLMSFWSQLVDMG